MWVAVAAVIAGAWYLYHTQSGSSYVSPTATTTPTTTSTTTAPTTRDVGKPATADDIVVTLPKEGDSISSPVTVTGRARGTWFFEASAPVVVIDTTGKTIGQGHIEATGDWMTTEFVPFSGSIFFAHATGTPTTGAIVFLNDNPSGQASTSMFTVVPVAFK